MSTRQKNASHKGVKGAVSREPVITSSGGGSSISRQAPREPVKRPVVSWTQDQWEAAVGGVVSEMGVALTSAQCHKLAAYMTMLAHWNSTFNLTALRAPEDMLSHHLADCLAVLPPLARHLASVERAPVRLLDVGSGGGLPGVVLAICCPGVHVTCVDTVGKKAAFIRQVAAELALPNLKGEHARVERLTGRFDVITSRAFASLGDFVGLTMELLTHNGVWMAMKGKQPDDELAALSPTISVFHVEQLAVPTLDAERCLVWMRRQGA